MRGGGQASRDERGGEEGRKVGVSHVADELGHRLVNTSEAYFESARTRPPNIGCYRGTTITTPTVTKAEYTSRNVFLRRPRPPTAPT